jgi:hypothetical protein
LTNYYYHDTLLTSTTNTGDNMKVGDLIQYKDNDYEGYGVVLEAPVDDDMVLFYFVDHYPDYIWDFKDQLEVVPCK